MKIKTSEATGRVLDWLVAKAEGHDVVVLTKDEQRARWFESVLPEKLEKEREEFNEFVWPTMRPKLCILSTDGYKRTPYHNEAAMAFNAGPAQFQHSTSWLQAGPIIEREKIDCIADPNGKDVWMGRLYQGQRVIRSFGPTTLIAAMRCYVSSKLGDEVDVPDELLEA